MFRFLFYLFRRLYAEYHTDRKLAVIRLKKERIISLMSRGDVSQNLSMKWAKLITDERCLTDPEFRSKIDEIKRLNDERHGTK